MELKIILNHVEKLPGFVYYAERLVDDGDRKIIEIEIVARKGSKPICSGCRLPGPGYDTLPVRRFEYVPLWGIVTFFLYAMRRVECHTCGIKVEQVPWATGKNHVAKTFSWFLAHWARRLSWQDVAVAFDVPWDTVFRSVKMAVAWGLEHSDLDNVRSIGVDEIFWHRKGDKFLTLVYQVDATCRRLLWVGLRRTEKTLGPVIN